MKKILSLLLAMLCVGSVGLMTSCGGDDDDVTPDPEPDPEPTEMTYEFAVSTSSETGENAAPVFAKYLQEKMGALGTATVGGLDNNIVFLDILSTARTEVETKLTDMQNNDSENLAALIKAAGFNVSVTVKGTYNFKSYYMFSYGGRSEMLFGTWSCSEKPGYKIIITREVDTRVGYATYKGILSTPDSTNIEGYIMLATNVGSFHSNSKVLYKPTKARRNVHEFHMEVGYDDDPYDKPKCSYMLTSETSANYIFEEVEFTKE